MSHSFCKSGCIPTFEGVIAGACKCLKIKAVYLKSGIMMRWRSLLKQKRSMMVKKDINDQVNDERNTLEWPGLCSQSKFIHSPPRQS